MLGFNFHFRQSHAMSRPLFKDLRKALKETIKFFQSKDSSLFKHKIYYKNLITKTCKSFESNIYKCIAS